MRAGIFAVLFALSTLAAVPAAAQQKAGEDRVEQAKQHYLTAEKAMQKGDYAIAAREYAIAYDIMRDPVLFYKIAYAREMSGDCEGALVYYGRYLKEAKPAESFVAQTEERIAACQKVVGKKPDASAAGAGDTVAPGGAAGDTATTEPGPAPGDAGGADTVAPGPSEPVDPIGDGGGQDVFGAAPPSFADEPPSWQRTAGWVAVGATVAFATTGAVMGLSARSREEDIENLLSFRDSAGRPAAFEGNTRQTYEELIDEGERFDTLAKVSFGLAGAAAVAATIFFILDATSEEAPATGSASRLVPVVGNDSFGVAAGWEF